MVSSVKVMVESYMFDSAGWMRLVCSDGWGRYVEVGHLEV